MEKVDTLIIGASFFGIGYAVSSNERCLVIESESLFGTDFVAALNASPCDTEKTYSAEAEALLKDAMNRNAVLSNGKTHIYALSTLLTKAAYDAKCDVILNTEVISIEKGDSDFVATLLNSDGITEVKAKRVIDTRVPENPKLYGAQKFICGMLVTQDSLPPLNEIENDELCIQQGLFDEEYILQVKIDCDDDWSKAREKFHSVFSKYRFSLLGGRECASVASSFAYKFISPVHEDRNGIQLCVSASYPNFISAYNGGSLCASEQ